jgi:hypothetical protein
MKVDISSERRGVDEGGQQLGLGADASDGAVKVLTVQPLAADVKKQDLRHRALFDPARPRFALPGEVPIQCGPKPAAP